MVCRSRPSAGLRSEPCHCYLRGAGAVGRAWVKRTAVLRRFVVGHRSHNPRMKLIALQFFAGARSQSGRGAGAIASLHIWLFTQAVAQSPQWSKLLLKSTQRPSQLSLPSGHTHAPSTHIPPTQGESHAPQCSTLVCVSTHFSEQIDSSPGHAHSPCAQLARAGQAAPHTPQFSTLVRVSRLVAAGRYCLTPGKGTRLRRARGGQEAPHLPAFRGWSACRALVRHSSPVWTDALTSAQPRAGGHLAAVPQCAVLWF